MRNILSFAFIGIIGLSLFSSCVRNKTTRTFTMTRPVYKVKQEVYNEITTHSPTTILSGGKLFIKGNYIFITEKNKGIHLINNSVPSSPVNESFIPVPGIEDVVVKDNILLADCFIDLLSIDISNPSDVKLVNVSKNVFPERRFVNGFSVDSNSVITEWITKDTTTEYNYYYWYTQNMTSGTSGFDNSGVAQPMTANSAGVAGSMARFALVNNYLYTVSTSTMHIFDVVNPISPIVKNDVIIGWNIETMFPLKEQLFLGSQTGMFVYSIANPVQPVQLCTFAHANNCDPVIADGNFAYITLRSGTACMGISNQLDIVDISNINNPSLVKTYNLTNPHGLSKDGNILFICDGNDGLKIFDASDVNALQPLKTIAMPTTYDVITLNKKAFVSTSEGLYQYDYSDMNNIHLISKISIN